MSNKIRKELLKTAGPYCAKCHNPIWEHAESAKNRAAAIKNGAIRHAFKKMSPLDYHRYMFNQLDLRDKRILFERAISSGMPDIPTYCIQREKLRMTNAFAYSVVESTTKKNLTASEVLQYLFKFDWSMIGL